MTLKRVINRSTENPELQPQLNVALDLDKNDAQAAEPAVAPQLEAVAVPLSREPATPKMARPPLRLIVRRVPQSDFREIRRESYP